MNTSQSLINIIPALLESQKEITFAAKDSNNPFFKSKYADLVSVIDAVKPHLNDHGIVFIQTVDPSEQTSLSLTTRLIHSSGEWIEGIATMPLIKSDPQSYGSAISYLRRYSLSAVCGLYADDDDANEASSHVKSKEHKLKSDSETHEVQPKKTHSATDGAFESLEKDVQKWIIDLSQQVISAYEIGNDVAILELLNDVKDPTKGRGIDEATALWSILKPYSKIRAHINKLMKKERDTNV